MIQTIKVHGDNFDSGVTPFVIQELQKRGYDPFVSEADLVINIDSIHNTGIRKGKKRTIYIENDSYIYQGSNYQYYDAVDRVYISQKNVLDRYPIHTKVVYGAFDPDWHKNVDVSKTTEYIFIGSTAPIPVYENRNKILNELNITPIYGARDEYPKLLSSGKIILNILPRVGHVACLNLKLYEAMATGCLMTDYDSVLDEIAIKDIHYLTLDKYKKTTDEEIARIAKASREHVLKHYTYAHYITNILEDIEAYDRLL